MSFDYFYDELVQTLAEGDPTKLGSNCPGPSIGGQQGIKKSDTGYNQQQFVVEKQQPAKPSKPVFILLADDSPTVQKIVSLTFSDEGGDVLTVNNGDEAFHRLQYLRPRLVMADVSIPGKNGYEICEFVKNHPEMKDTPVVLLVPAFELFDEERAIKVGADIHITKPFQSIRTLIVAVRSLTDK